MKVLVTDGSGVVGAGAVAALLERGHSVRLISGQGRRAAASWPHGVEARVASLTASPTALEAAARGCDAILHVATIAEEDPPERTFAGVNVNGTRNLVAAAAAAGLPRLVFVSSLGAPQGGSDYHRSLREAETLVRGYDGSWLILRPGVVYGPGDATVSALLGRVRTWPALPVLEHGAQRFQPVWYLDLGRALASATEMPEVSRVELDLAGPDQTTVNEVLDELSTLVGRRPARVAIPASLAELGAQATAVLGVKGIVSDTQLKMLEEEAVIPPASRNALSAVFGVEPTPLSAGLRALVELEPERLPTRGVGPLRRKRFWADIKKTHHDPKEMRDLFRKRFREVMPLDTDREGEPWTTLKKGTTFTVKVPVLGAFPMRVLEVEPDRVTAVSVGSHPLGGMVSFLFRQQGQGLRFEVVAYVRAGNLLDRAVLETVGGFLQDMHWRVVVERVVELSGGTAPRGVQNEADVVPDDEALALEQRVAALVERRQRETAPPLSAAGAAPRRGSGPAAATRRRRPARSASRS
jgi:NADH dehydrogenase